MGDRLRTDLALIRDLGGGLRSLQQQFSGLFVADSDDFTAEAGVPVLAQALTEFTGDWRIRQQNLIADLGDLARLADAAATAYGAADRDLATALTKALTAAEAPPSSPPPMHGHSRAE